MSQPVPAGREVITPNREHWLQWGVQALRPRFESVGHPLPERVHVSVGFPTKRALSVNGRVIGQCWSGSASRDGSPHVFVSPTVNNGLTALGVLAHELVHAVLPVGSGHKAPFIKVCKVIGLTDGKPTHAMPGPELQQELERLNAERPYPHSAIDATTLPKAQATRLLKVECPECGYTVRVTRSWLEQGAPICPLDEIRMEEA